MRQFNKVDCRRGAPMGRPSYGNPDIAEGRITVVKVRLDEGYDDGGAYWGQPSNLYCARDTGHKYRAFVRARSRDHAKRLLGLP